MCLYFVRTDVYFRSARRCSVGRKNNFSEKTVSVFGGLFNVGDQNNNSKGIKESSGWKTKKQVGDKWIELQEGDDRIDGGSENWNDGVIKEKWRIIEAAHWNSLPEVRCWYLGLIQENLNRRSTPMCFTENHVPTVCMVILVWRRPHNPFWVRFRCIGHSNLLEFAQRARKYKYSLNIIQLWCVRWFWSFGVPENHPEVRIRYGGS